LHHYGLDEHDHSAANRYHAGQDQGVAETELLDRDPERNRQEARQHGANPGDQQDDYHQTSPPGSRP
jgi:hypothetical protein